MKYPIRQLAAIAFVLSSMGASGEVRYVNVNSASPTPPYTNWATAATNIQDAVDVAVAGDQILVTNGVYQTGGRLVFGAITNRVAVNKPVTVQSVNGAEVTVIRGFQVPGTTNGNTAIRCVYLINGAALVGFTLTNGATRARNSGDDQPETGGGVWCESASAVVSNCTITANSAGSQGGGAFGGTLNNCTLTSNTAYDGGGVLNCTLNNCTLSGNSALGEGGGASDGTLNNCTLTANSAAESGGGASWGTLNNCILSGNSAGREGGGAYDGTLSNCTLSGNWAGREGGGASGGTLNNCIVYYNTALQSGDNYSSDIDNSYEISFSHSCTTPLPPGGAGNISAEPQLASTSHLSAGSPCRGSGSTAYSIGLDIDGETWANPPSMGCDEYHPGAVTGPLSVNIQVANTNLSMGFTVNLTAAIDGRATASRWEFGDGTVVGNQPYTSHSWALAGDYSVVLQTSNETYPSGISSTVTVHVVAQPVHYVALASPHPAAPYTSWATAANNIQDAVDAALVAGALVMVTNGVYQTGGRAAPELARVAVTKPLVLRSVNGAAVTVIQGESGMQFNGGVRCVYLANGAALMGFTLTNGTGSPGGGVWCESHSAVVSDCVLTGNLGGISGGGASGGTLNNCTLRDNSAFLLGQGGGGASFSTLNKCTLTGNSADGNGGGGARFCTLNDCRLTGNSAIYGGGAHNSTLNNCTLTGNSGGGASQSTLNNCTLTENSGGGASGCTLNNCIVYYNSAPNEDNYTACVLSYSCTTPLPTNGIANISNAPFFVDYPGGNLRLQSNSPCINAGSNASAPAGSDLDGNPRIAGGTVDVGAYEFQSPQSLISYAWLQQYNLPTDGSADDIDPDGDGLNNWQEWRSGTNPGDALSALRLLSAAPGAQGVIVSWPSVSGLNYFLERGTDLGAQPPFRPLATNIVGLPGTTTFTDTNAVGAGPFFYRVGVQE